MAALRNGIQTVIIPADTQGLGRDRPDGAQCPPLCAGGPGGPGALRGHPHPRRGGGGEAAPWRTTCPAARAGGLPACASEEGAMPINLQKGGVHPLRRLPQGLYPGRAAPGGLCRPLQCGQVLRHQPAAEPEEVWPGWGPPPARPPTSTTSISTGPSIWWTCPATATPRCPKGERDRWGKLMESYFADRSQMTLGVMIVDARHKPRRTTAPWQSGTGRGLPRGGGGQQAGQAEKERGGRKPPAHPGRP